MIMIAIDAGNTRIKWGVHDGHAWVALGAVPTAAADRLADAAMAWPARAHAVACNVAGKAVGQCISDVLAARFSPLTWLSASGAACGVNNSYEQPEQLGADRWAALIGARALQGNAGHASLVVCAGTATTVDWLDAHGVFRGGVILPGVDLMRAALARNTAQLPLAAGEFRAEPRNTTDAIVSGCLHAQIGAIERLFASVAVESGALCLLTGGAVQCLAPLLRIPYKRIDTLILDGLRRFGLSMA